MNFNLKKALLAGTAIVAVGGFAVGANAQTAITTDTDLDGAAVGALTDTDTPVVTIDSAAVTVSADYSHSQTANENLFQFITAGPSSLTINDGVTVTSDGTGDLISTVGDLSGITVTVNGVLTASAATEDAINFGTLGATNGGTINIVGGASTDGNVTGVITGGAGADTMNINLTEGNSVITGAVDLGAETDVINVTGGANSVQFTTTVAADTINIAADTTVNADGDITGNVVNAGILDISSGAAAVTGNITGAGELNVTGAATVDGNITQGTLDLDAAGTLNGNVSATTIELGASSAITGTASATTTDIANGQVLTVDAGSEDAGSASLGAVTLGDGTSGVTVISNAGASGVMTFSGTITGDDNDGVITLGNDDNEIQNYTVNATIGTDAADVEDLTIGGNTNAAVITATLNGNAFVDDVDLGNGDVLNLHGTTYEFDTVDSVGANDANTLNVGSGTSATALTVNTHIGTTQDLANVNVRDGATLNIGGAIVTDTAINIDGTVNVTGASAWTGATTIGADGAGTVNLSQVVTLNSALTVGDGTGDTARLVYNEVAGFDPDATTGLDANGQDVTLTPGTVTTIQLGSADNAFVAGDTITFIDNAGGGGTSFTTALDDNRLVFASDTLLTLTNNGSTATTLTADVGYRDAAAAFGNSSTGEGVANYLVGLGAGGTTAEQTLRNSLLGLAGEALEERAESLAPTVDGGFVVGANQAAGLSNATTNTRMAALRGGEATGMVAGEMGDGVGVWGKAFGQMAEQDEREGVAGYDADTYGFALGIDSENLMNDAVFGLSFSYGDTEVDSDSLTSTETDIDSYQLSLYGNKDLQDDMYVSGILGYAWNDIDQTRFNVLGTAGNNANADFDSDQFMLYAEFGKDFMMDNKMTLTPRVLANYQHVSIDGYTETGSTANLSVDTDDMDIFEMGLGVTAAWDLQDDLGNMVKPSLSAEYRYDFVGDEVESTSSFTGGGASFKTEGFDPAQSTFELGAAVEYSMDNNWTVSADYGYTFKEDYDAHSASLRAGYKF